MNHFFREKDQKGEKFKKSPKNFILKQERVLRRPPRLEGKAQKAGMRPIRKKKQSY